MIQYVLRMKRSFSVVVLVLTLMSVLIYGIYWSFLQVIKKTTEELFEAEKAYAASIAKSIADYVQQRTEYNVGLRLQDDPEMHEELELFLHHFVNKRYPYLFVIGKKKSDRYYYLLDGTRLHSEKAEFLQPFDPVLPQWSEVFSQCQPVVARQNGIGKLWLSCLQPICRHNKVEAVLVLDVSKQALIGFNERLRPLRIFLKWLAWVLTAVAVLAYVLAFLIFRQKKQAYIDPLTHLFNRRYLDEHVKHVDMQQTSVALIDIDHFKQVNDRFGHDIGDEVLEAVARRLMGLTRSGDLLVRYGGEEFLLLIHIEKDPFDESMAVLRRIHNAFQSHALRVHQFDIDITLSIGLRIHVYKDRSIADSIKKADTMLYRAKARGRNRIEVFDESISYAHTLSIESVTRAIDEGRIRPIFQPIRNVSSEKIEKFEMLVRIVDQDNRVRKPAEFLPLLKNTNTYRVLSQTMLLEGLEIIRKHEIGVSINFNILDFLDDVLFGQIIRTLEEDLEAVRHLTLEIIESDKVHDMAMLTNRLEHIRSYGVSISVDDFGSGYSNYFFLMQLRPDSLKIDGSLIRNIRSSDESRLIVTSIIRLCQALDIQSVAEFVEDEATYYFIKKLGIDYAQGYFIGKPSSDLRLF